MQELKKHFSGRCTGSDEARQLPCETCVKKNMVLGRAVKPPLLGDGPQDRRVRCREEHECWLVCWKPELPGLRVEMRKWLMEGVCIVECHDSPPQLSQGVQLATPGTHITGGCTSNSDDLDVDPATEETRTGTQSKRRFIHSTETFASDEHLDAMLLTFDDESDRRAQEERG